MKKLLSLPLVFSLVFGLVPVSYFAVQTTFAYTSPENPTAPSDTPNTYVINIPDANLKARLNATINASRPATQNITFAEAKGVTGTITANDSNINNLEGIQYFINATNVQFANLNNTTVDNNAITTIAPLATLTKVQNLDMRSNTGLTDTASLQSMTALRTVRGNGLPNGNQIIHDIKDLPHLNNIHLGSTNLTTLAPLVNPTLINNLKYLYINTNPIGNDNIQAIKNFTNLLQLEIAATNTTDLDFLNDITSLTHLSILNNQISDFSPLQRHPITWMNAQNTGMKSSDLEHINPAIQQLRITQNKIEDLRELANKPNLIYTSGIGEVRNETHTMTTLARVFPNPIKNVDGDTIPVIETAVITNVNADGTPNVNGTHLKIADTLMTGSTVVEWSGKMKTSIAHTGLQNQFTGKLTIHLQEN